MIRGISASSRAGVLQAGDRQPRAPQRQEHIPQPLIQFVLAHGSKPACLMEYDKNLHEPSLSRSNLSIPYNAIF